MKLNILASFPYAKPFGGTYGGYSFIKYKIKIKIQQVKSHMRLL